MTAYRLLQAGRPVESRELTIDADSASLEAELAVPADAVATVLFAHRAGSTRTAAADRHLAFTLQDAGFATVLVDLLTPGEEAVDFRRRHLRRNHVFLGERLLAVMGWMRRRSPVGHLPVGILGAGTGAAGALHAAASDPGAVGAVVSRGGHVELAEPQLPMVSTPTLFVVGTEEEANVLDANRRAAGLVAGEASVEVVPGAGHGFEEPGALDFVAGAATKWFERHLVRPSARGNGQ